MRQRRRKKIDLPPQIQQTFTVHAYTVYMYMKTPIWSTLHHPKGTTQKGTTRG